MSVAVLIELKPGVDPPEDFPAGGYVPVAPERTFLEEWLPRAEGAGLQWVALFGPGMKVGEEDVEVAVAELDVLAALVTAPEIGHVAERVALVRELLTTLPWPLVENLWIG